jgi:hypothetical protein
MLRRLLLGVLLASVVSCHRAADAPRTGTWVGDTTQGYPIQFKVEGRFITRMVIRIDLRCERTERVVRAMLGFGFRIPIEDGRFSAVLRGMTMFSQWDGAFTPSGKANGHFDAVVAVLTGDKKDDLGTEKCAATGLGWAARPGQRRDVPPADVYITVDRDGVMTTTSTPSATTGW